MKNIFLLVVLSVLPLFVNSQYFDYAKLVGTEIISNTADNLGNHYATGGFRGTVDFDPGTSVYNLTSGFGEDIFIQKLNPNGDLSWAISLGLGGDDNGQSISTDNAGNVYVTGYYYGTVDFNPGTAVFNLTSNNGAAAFILKLNASGAFLWAKSIEGELMFSEAKGFSIEVSDLGNVFVTGDYDGSVDFNPGNSTFSMSSNANTDFFILKLDNNGDFVWAKSIGAGMYDRVKTIAVDHLENVYVTGNFSQTVDFNPNAPIFNLTAESVVSSIFILKLDGNGDFLWAKSIGGKGYYDNFRGDVMAIDKTGNVFITSNYTNTLDFDPGNGVFNLTSIAGDDIFVLKLDFNGEFQWVKSIGGAMTDNGWSICTDDLGNVYTTGAYYYTVDFDPGIAVFNLTTNGEYDVFVQKLSPNGDFIWATSLGGPKSDKGQSVYVGPLDKVYVTGVFFNSTIDFDPSAAVFNLTATNNGSSFILELSQDSCSNIALVIDSVSNITCSDLGFVGAHASGGVGPYSYVWNTSVPTFDSIATITSSGIYTITATAHNNCIKSSSVLVDQASFLNMLDLESNLISSNFRPGFTSIISLDVLNDFCLTALSEFSLILDPLLTYESATIAPNEINGDTLVWHLKGMNYDSTHFKPTVKVTTKLIATIGDTIHLKTIINPSLTDADTTNNIKTYAYRVSNGYDPNDKQAYPAGECDQHYVKKDQLLTYTVRFQNTGNAQAINIFIIDTIDINLNINSARVMGKSHNNLITEVLPGNVLKFRFDEIWLADSTTNEAESHGYVIFEISPKGGVSEGTIIKNTSEIYFDFNPPVLTNTVLNTLTNAVPFCSTVSTEFNDDFTEILAYPNPTNSNLTIQVSQEVNISVFDLLGNCIQSQMQITGMHLFDVTSYSEGMYFLRVTTIETQKTETLKFIVER